MCIVEGCKISPSFNYNGETIRLYCAKHKKEGMVNVKYRTTCLECDKQPSFSYEGETKRLYCATHKKEGMVNVKYRTTCLECDKQPIFNFECETKGLYCATHKKYGMVNVISKTCLECDKQPSFSYEGQTKRLYCATHKKEGMVNVKYIITCLECNKQPSFNYEGETKALYCATHKKDGMLNIKDRTCLECNKRPSFNYEFETKVLYCATHKKDDMIDIIHKTCKTYLCSTQVQDKYDGYCQYCYMNLFPDKPVSRNYKTKEYAVVEFIKNKYNEYNWVSDKIISGGCSKRRPDLLLDLGYQIIIVEIDENQHIDYDCSCENKRIMELSLDLGHRPIVFIRFNPDDYINNGTSISSCWGINTQGISIIKKTKRNEWEERLNVLDTNINYWINQENKTNKTVEIIELYYDR